MDEMTAYSILEPVVILLALLAVIYILWVLFYRPYNLFRDYTEFGFEENSDTKRYKNNALKQHVVNEYLRRKKIGDLPPFFPNGWFAILESDELPVTAVKEVDALGQNLVVWRGQSGKCYAADAYCPHLGAHLGVGGKVKNECVECPFHGWQFEGCSGKLVSIQDNDEGLPPANLKMWETHESCGFIYLWYHAEKEKPSWWPNAVPEVETGKWKYRGRTDFRAACHIQEIPENGADLSHLKVVHAAPAPAGIQPEKSLLKPNFLKHLWSASWAPNLEAGKEHEALMQICHHLLLFNKIQFCHVDVKVYQIGPGIVQLYLNTVLGKAIFVQTVTPLGPMLQKIVHRFYSSSTFLHPIALLSLYGEGAQISRDIQIWNRKTYLQKPIFTKDDKQIKLFRRWYSQFYSNNSVKVQLKSKELNF